MNEDPPPSVLKVREEMQKQGSSAEDLISRLASENNLRFPGRDQEDLTSRFAGIVEENPDFFHGHLGKKREEMPQLRGEHLPGFLISLEEGGIQVVRLPIPASTLMATQMEMDSEKVSTMIANVESGKQTLQDLAGEVLVSHDNHILDGHHRWAAVFALDPSFEMPAIRIGMDIEGLLEAAEIYGGAKHETVRQAFSEIIAKAASVEDYGDSPRIAAYLGYPVPEERGVLVWNLQAYMNEGPGAAGMFKTVRDKRTASEGGAVPILLRIPAGTVVHQIRASREGLVNRLQATDLTPERKHSGLYGFRKATQRDCETCIRKLQRRAVKIARKLWATEGQEAVDFLTTHKARTKSRTARVLLTAMKGLGPRIAEKISKVASVGGPVVQLATDDTEVRVYESGGRFFGLSSTEGESTLQASDFSHSQMAAWIRERIARNPSMTVLSHDQERFVLEVPTGGVGKTASGSHGLYGFRSKTADRCLQACSQVRKASGAVAVDLHRRRAEQHGRITGFLKAHCSGSRCQFAKMLLDAYTDANRRLASVELPPPPNSVEGWLSL